MESTGGGESGAMCCDFNELGKVEYIFSIFSVKDSTNLSAKSRGAFINGSILACSLCNISPRTRHNLHADFVILVDSLHILKSVEV